MTALEEIGLNGFLESIYYDEISVPYVTADRIKEAENDVSRIREILESAEMDAVWNLQMCANKIERNSKFTNVEDICAVANLKCQIPKLSKTLDKIIEAIKKVDAYQNQATKDVPNLDVDSGVVPIATALNDASIAMEYSTIDSIINDINNGKRHGIDPRMAEPIRRCIQTSAWEDLNLLCAGTIATLCSIVDNHMDGDTIAMYQSLEDSKRAISALSITISEIQEYTRSIDAINRLMRSCNKLNRKGISLL